MLLCMLLLLFGCLQLPCLAVLIGFLEIKIADPITVRPVRVWGFSFGLFIY